MMQLMCGNPPANNEVVLPKKSNTSLTQVMEKNNIVSGNNYSHYLTWDFPLVCEQ